MYGRMGGVQTQGFFCGVMSMPHSPYRGESNFFSIIGLYFFWLDSFCTKKIYIRIWQDHGSFSSFLIFLYIM